MGDGNTETRQLLERSIAMWDSEGGASSNEPPAPMEPGRDREQDPQLSNAELVNLRVRVIALENLVIALMSQASNQEVDIAKEMAALILPRPGYKQHPLTIKAAEHMSDLLDRAARFKSMPPSAVPYKSTRVFDENTLPAGFRKEHMTKAGVWGVIRVLEGQLRYEVLDPVSDTVIEPGVPGLILPEQPHRVEPIGQMRMLVEFYNQLPSL
ncbi:DUF1971 domain-containing protein [Pelagibacterium luteolum]|uniref:Uncharacterized protein, possibly involved in tellurite resistance n=1 Tax=Pelagibacterium luteolum TaxID=440168 RepID=A0A1G7XMC2_9HYPH|nr:DUF1971 domain-containing protein [Pelagibacterium luteolum]SDG85364.1 Uncharacterized protein, possibly involved in tellurite resistance [Pelagibacterium luteolum]